MRALALPLLIAGCGRIDFDRVAIPDAVLDARVDALPDAADVRCGGKTHALYPVDTYDNARAFCASMTGWLVTIDDAMENDHVQNVAGGAEVWIGYADLAVEGTFTWVGPAGTSYTNWAAGQPNDGGSGGTTEDCGAMRADGLWYDEDCITEVFPFVCQCAVTVW